MAEKKWEPTSGNKWATAANWNPSGVPEAGDDVKFGESSANCEVTTSQKCRSFDAEKYKGTLSFIGSLSVGTSTEAPSKIAARFGTAMTVTLGAEGKLKFASTASSSGEKIFAAGKVLPAIEIATGTTTTNKWVLEEELKCAGIKISKGALNTNGVKVVTAPAEGVGGGVLVETANGGLTLGASVVKVEGEAAGVAAWSVDTLSTLSAASSTIELAGTLLTEGGFSGGAKTYGTLTITRKRVLIKLSNTFATINNNGASATLSFEGTTVEGSEVIAAVTPNPVTAGLEADELIAAGTFAAGTTIVSKTATTITVSTKALATHVSAIALTVQPSGLRIEKGSTQTVTSYTSNGESGKLSRLASDTAGSAATITKASGQVSTDYSRIMDSTAAGTSEWYAGANSVNVSGNSVWKFEAPPATSVRQNMVV